MLGIIAAVASAAASISSGMAAASIPVVGTMVDKGAGAIGTAVGSAVTSAGGSGALSTIASGVSTTAVNGSAIGAYNSIKD